AIPVAAPAGVVDTCGTGGDGLKTFNISTAAALVAAGAGAVVAKHGNRAATSACGSSDVLAALGVPLDAPKGAVERAFLEAGCAFLYAPRHHPALARVAPLRRALGVRTIFNLLGPLANPAGARRQVVGVASARHLEPMAGALARLGVERALVVHGSDGLDELTVAGDSEAIEVSSGVLRRIAIHPSAAGLATSPTASLRGGGPAENAAALRRLLDGEKSAYRDVVILNAAACLMVAGIADSLGDGAERARRSIDDGRARRALEALVAIMSAAS
ncbi:MAG: anthranilate phosphoribosyltransferase, partial [Parvularculaceae bacterium]|nr:anthranilate phosphoribosyltransferase [Parvularculaceae bacterium]